MSKKRKKHQHRKYFKEFKSATNIAEVTERADSLKKKQKQKYFKRDQNYLSKIIYYKYNKKGHISQNFFKLKNNNVPKNKW